MKRPILMFIVFLTFFMLLGVSQAQLNSVNGVQNTEFLETSLPLAEPNSNLLTNPSFENGYTGWKWEPTNTSCSRAIYTDTPHGGAKFLATARNNAYPNCNSVYQDVFLIPQIGETFTYGVWLKAPWGPQSNIPVTLWFTGQWDNPGQAALTASLDNTWRCFQVTLTIHHIGQNNRLRPTVYLPNLGPDVNIDDVYLGRGAVQYCPTAPTPTATPPVPVPTPPPPNQSIINAAKSLTGMPYSATRNTFCSGGVYGPWKATHGVCTDVAIDAYLWGTGGQSVASSCGTNVNTTMRKSSGGINLELLLYQDYLAHRGRYRWGSARNSEDMRRYFLANQQYISCSSSNWRVGDIGWFDWGGDGKADHTVVVSQVSNGKPTSVFHAPGCSGSNCSCANHKACETNTNWWSRNASKCMAGGRLATSMDQSNLLSFAPQSLGYLRVSSTNINLDIVVYDSNGKKAGQIIDYSFVAENNEDFIPYIPYQDYGTNDTEQWLALYNPEEGAYRIQLTAQSDTPYDLSVSYVIDDIVQETIFYSGSLNSGQQVASPLVFTPNASGNKLSVERPSPSPIIEIPSLLTITSTASLLITELSSVSDVTGIHLTMSDLQTQEGLIIPASALSVSENNFSITSGGNKNILVNIAWPGKAGSTYRGQLVLTSQNGISRQIPIEFIPNQDYSIYLPAILR